MEQHEALHVIGHGVHGDAPAFAAGAVLDDHVHNVVRGPSNLQAMGEGSMLKGPVSNLSWQGVWVSIGALALGFVAIAVGHWLLDTVEGSVTARRQRLRCLVRRTPSTAARMSPRCSSASTA